MLRIVFFIVLKLIQRIKNISLTLKALLNTQRLLYLFKTEICLMIFAHMAVSWLDFDSKRKFEAIFMCSYLNWV